MARGSPQGESPQQNPESPREPLGAVCATCVQCRTCFSTSARLAQKHPQNRGPAPMAYLQIAVIYHLTSHVAPPEARDASLSVLSCRIRGEEQLSRPDREARSALIFAPLRATMVLVLLQKTAEGGAECAPRCKVPRGQEQQDE